MRLPIIKRDQPVGDGLVQLLPLTPNYQPDHEVYWKAIESALTGENRRRIRNIALTGSYGVGKSSILQKVVETHNVVQISLSTLGLSDDLVVADRSSRAAGSTTNRIQKEIVKQLLYQEEPVKMPGSRYRRLERFKFWQSLWVAALVAVAVSLVFYLTGWTQRIGVLAKSFFDLGSAVHLVVFGAATIFVLASEALFHNRIRVEQLSAGAATISLSPSSATFFDEYLDEIVYFFDVTKHDIVIFEDIDRFDDPRIFETLRALNTLLNGAKQLKNRDIRFIYAIKDSIFDELGARGAIEERELEGSWVDAADTEIARANRTKFFDLVIPVVPFITHRSARDLIAREMNEVDRNISQGLIDLVARQLPDMRLIRNMRNEFVIFREKILRDKDSIPGLREDQLFAMMVYKSTHISDFEAIKNGKSKLDLLYGAGRMLVKDRITSLDDEALNLRARMRRLDSKSARSERLGDALWEYITQVTSLMPVNVNAPRSVTFAGQQMSAEGLRSEDFWQEFVEAGGTLDIRVTTQWGYPHQFSLSLAQVSAAVDDSLSLDDWRQSDKTELAARLRELAEERDFLGHADMGDLMRRDELTVESAEGGPRSYRQLVSEHLDSELARQLVEAGYINKDFTLYTSTYYAERVSSQAMNFIIHNVDQDVPDAHFMLTPDEVEEVLRERGDSVLGERGLYNIFVLDNLLRRHDSRADFLINKLMTFGAEEQSFLQTYLSGGNQQELLIRRLTDRWALTFDFIIGKAELDETVRGKLLDTALSSMTSEINYAVDERARRYFEEHYAELDIMGSDDTSAEIALLIARLLAAMGARLESLAPLGAKVRQAVIAESRYRITGDNLVVATGGSGVPALDCIRERHPAVYAYVLDHLPEYLTALRQAEPKPVTIRAADAFEAIIEDVLDHSKGVLLEVVALASPECQVPSLAEVSEAAWPILADQGRFTATFENVKGYIGAVGQVDAALADILTKAGSIKTLADADESDKEELASRLLAARHALPDPALRTGLVADLELKGFLSADSIQTELGKLIGLLIERRIIADDDESFALTLETDWQTREFVISKSTQFTSYMTPIQVPPNDIVPLMGSSIVPDSVKKEILNRFDEFVPTDNQKALTAMATFAVSKGEKVAIEFIARMATSRVESRLVLRLLEPLLPELQETQLVPILQELGDEYAAVSERNGKRPRLPKTQSDLALVIRLKELGVVSSHRELRNVIAVNMRKD